MSVSDGQVRVMVDQLFVEFDDNSSGKIGRKNGEYKGLLSRIWQIIGLQG